MFDTLKLKVSDPDLLDKKKMIRVETIHPESQDISIKYVYPRTLLGAYIMHKKDEDFFTVEFSAKILRDKYLLGIGEKTKDTLENYIERNCLCIRKKFDTFSCGVFRADHTLNLFSDDVTGTIRYLRESATWGRKLTDRRFFDSAIFFNTRESLIAYDKVNEVKKFWGEFKTLDIPIEKYSNILRFEYRPKKLDIIRKQVNQNSKFDELNIPKLCDIIKNYKKTINEKVENFKFAEIDDIEDYSEFLFGSGKLDTNLKILGLYTYFKSIGFDEKVMEKDIEKIFLKSQKSKFRAKLKDFRKAIPEKKEVLKYKESFLQSIERALNEY